MSLKNCASANVINQCLYKRSQKEGRGGGGIGYILMFTVKTMFDRLNDVPKLCHKAFATSASSDKTAFALHFLDAFLT